MNRKITYRKVFEDFKKVSKITECFYHDKNSCKGEIKQSHSLQKNGRLSIIEGDVNGQKLIYTFSEAELDEKENIIKLIPIGKKIASTFFGFCDYHDSALFYSIENTPFDESNEHCFLHSYRSFAHTYHIQKESLKGSITFLNATNVINKKRWQSMVEYYEPIVLDLERAKSKLDILLEEKEFDALEYFTCTISKEIPIACSSTINPLFSFKNIKLKDELNTQFPLLMLTVLPDQDKTIIILACFSNDTKGKILLDELNNIKYPLQFEKAMSSLLINNADNTFFAPALWEALGTDGQRILCEELQSIYKPVNKFADSKINFFDQKFSAKKLGI
jgi:hypothetical protein